MALPGMDATAFVPPAGPMYCDPRAHHEWVGSGTSKFLDRNSNHLQSRKIVETHCRNGDRKSLARNGFVGYFTDPSGLVMEEGKRPIPHGSSAVCDWRPAKRPLSEPGAHHLEKPEGLKRVEQKASAVRPVKEKRHIRQMESKEEHSDRPRGPQTVVRHSGPGAGGRAADVPATEVDVTHMMARKIRGGTLDQARNGIGCSSLGDKCYRHPEYARDFYKVGSLIVGSSFVQGHHKKTEARNSTNWMAFVGDGTTKHCKSYEEKQAEADARQACQEVEELTRQWEAATLRECEDAKYEDLDSEDEGPAGDPAASPPGSPDKGKGKK